MESHGDDSGASPSRGWWVAIAVVAIGVLATFEHFGQSGRGGVAAASVGVLLLVLLYNIHLRRRLQFWAVITIFALFHVIVIFAPPWSNGAYSMYAFFPFCIVDAAVCFFILRKLENGLK